MARTKPRRAGLDSGSCWTLSKGVARVACGVAYASDALRRTKPDVETVRTGLATARREAAGLAKASPEVAKAAGSVAKSAAAVLGRLKGKNGMTKKDLSEARSKAEALAKGVSVLEEAGRRSCGA